MGAIFVDRPELKIARVHVSTQECGIAILPMHYLVGTPQGVEQFTELHELALFSHDEYLTAYSAAGLDVVYDQEGLMGRGLYIGILPEPGGAAPTHPSGGTPDSLGGPMGPSTRGQ